jgi:hypothetical protein
VLSLPGRLKLFSGFSSLLYFEVDFGASLSSSNKEAAVALLVRTLGGGESFFFAEDLKGLKRTEFFAIVSLSQTLLLLGNFELGGTTQLFLIIAAGLSANFDKSPPP